MTSISKQCFTSAMEREETAGAELDGPPSALTTAIEASGGPAALARFITQNYGPITAQAVCDWKRCPATRVLQVEAATKGKVTRFQLRPDLYPPEQLKLATA